MRVGTKVLHSIEFYPLILLIPLIFGINGYYSRLEGVLLIILGGLFYHSLFKGSIGSNDSPTNHVRYFKSLMLLIFALAILLVGAHFTVVSATAIASTLGVNPILIGMLIVGLGTTMPELFFSLKSINKEEDSLAVGDLLGTVLADATIVVGIIAVISPFAFPAKIVYVTGVFMLVGAMILIKFMRSGRKISHKEGALLLAFWLLYVIVELFVSY